MTALKALSSDTIRLIGSTQVITSVSSVIKELIENSLDAGATSVDVKLENYGLDRIEIKDNGKGIPENDIPYVAKRHYTSKISAFTDLEQLLTYGFRGEALASLCAVSEVMITTRTASEAVARSLVINNTGDVVSTKFSPQLEGTTISAVKLFKNLPVRQQFCKNDKRRKDELKKVENLVMAFGIIKPKIRFTLRHNKDVLWQKAAVDTLRSSVLTAWGYSVVQHMEHLQQTKEDPEISVEMLVPKFRSDVMSMSKTGGDQGFVYVNKRPVNLKNIQKVIRQYYCSSHNCDTNRYPLFVASISLPQKEMDVNLDPNKTQVLMHNDDIVMDVITILLESVYGTLGSVPGRKTVCENKSDKTHNTDEIETRDPPQMLDINHVKPSSQDSCSPPMGSLLHVTESKSEHSALAVKQKSTEMNSSCDDIDRSYKDPEQTHNIPPTPTPPPSQEKPIPNSADSCFLLELSTNSVDLLSQSNSLDDTKDSSAAPRDPVINLSTSKDLLPETPKQKTEELSDTFSCELFGDEDLVGSFTVDTPVATEPASDKKTKTQSQGLSLLDDNLRAADFLDSFNEPVDAETWSRGKMKSVEGTLVQPVQLFAPSAHHTPGKRPPSPSRDSELEPVAKKKAVGAKINYMEGQTTLYDLVESQPVKRPETSFDIFSKEIRPKVMEEYPDADYKTLSELIVKKWKSLTDEEKAEYENFSKKDLKRYEDQMNSAKERAANKIINNKPKASMKVKPGHTPGREKLLKTCKLSVQTPLKRQYLKVKMLPFSMDQLKKKLSHEYNSSQSSWTSADHLVPVGYLPSRDAWVCHQGVRLALLNPHRVDEVLIYQRLMESFQVNAEPLQNPILLNDKLSGGERIWKTLMSLKHEDHATSSHQVISDQRLLANGFTVAIYKENSSLSSEVPQVEITGLTSHVPMYGFKDLQEVLENIATIGPSTSLMQCRPLKIVNYLKSEAVRMARSSPTFSSRDDITDLLERISKTRKWSCLHDKPFLHDIYNLSDLPFSQETLMESQQSVG